VRNDTSKTSQIATRPGGKFASLMALTALLALGLVTNPVYAITNYFSYDELHLQLGMAIPDSVNIPHSMGSDEYNMIPTWGLRGSFQHKNTGFIFTTNLTQAQQSTQYTKLQQNSYSLKMGYALGFFNRFDVYAHFGQYIDNAKACADQNCIKVNQQNQGLDFGFRAWAKPNIEWGINQRINHLTKDQQTFSTSLQLAYLIGNHNAITSSLLYSEQNSVMTLGYRYSF
jgi:hypothetical protein